MLGTDHSRRNSHAYGLLHAICATAVSDGLIVSNPSTITGVMNPRASVTRPSCRWPRSLP